MCATEPFSVATGSSAEIALTLPFASAFVYLLQPLQQPPPLIAGARPRGAGAGSTLGACLRLRPNDSPPLKESCLSDGCEASPFFEIEARPLGVASSRRRPPAHSALVQLVLCFKSHCGRLLSSCGRPGE